MECFLYEIFGIYWRVIPNTRLTFPIGLYNISLNNKTYTLISSKTLLINKSVFAISDELSKFYKSVEGIHYDFLNKFPIPKNMGILLSFDCFITHINNFFANDSQKDLKEIARRLPDYYNYVYIILEHDFDENKYTDPLDYINVVRGKEKFYDGEKIFFEVIRNFYEYMIIVRSPYINTTELSNYSIKRLFSFFADDTCKLITNVRNIPYNCWEPRWDDMSKTLRSFFDKKIDIPIDNLFMAKAKVYLRLNDYSMALIHAIISLEIVVPNYINNYFKTRGIDKDSIKDFNMKFGLSVRVKAILKLILPKKHHGIITSVGAAIKYRNKIMHEGITNSYFELNGVNVNKLIEDCDNLLVLLKK